jgi:Tol biopolymer transport system component
MKRTDRNLIAVISIVLLATTGFSQVRGPYFGQEPPGMTLEILAPGFICLDNRYEYGCAFSPDGTEFAFTLTNDTWGWFDILYTTMDEAGLWCEPYRPDFVGTRIQGLYPCFSPDASKVYFCSPLYQGPTWDSDIFVSQRSAGGWSAPANMGRPVNSTGMEYRPSITDDGTLYLLSTRDGNGDIYRCPLADSGSVQAEKLGAPINTGELEGSPFIAPDESYLIFESGRASGYGQNDLYISFRQEDGSWGRVVNLGPTVNSEAIEDAGFVTHDGKYFLFCRRVAYTTNVQTDIYWMDARSVLPDPNGPIRNLTTGQRFGSLQCAVNYAQEGDTLHITSGWHHESVVIDKDIRIQSEDPNDPLCIGGTILQGSPDRPVILLQDGTDFCEIAGLTVRGGSVGIVGVATNATIRDCRIMDNVTHGAELSQESRPLLSHCLIASNGQAGVAMVPTVGGRRTTHCKPVIEKCVIVDNGAAAIDGGEPVIAESIMD